MKCLIVEPAFTGHRLHFVKLVANALQSYNIEYEFVLPSKAKRSEEFKGHLGDELQAGKIHWLDIDLNRSSILNLSAYLSLITFSLSISEKINAKHILIPTADGIAHSALFSRRIANRSMRNPYIHALLIGGGFAYPTNNLLKKLKNRLNIAILRRLPFFNTFHLDPFAFELLRFSSSVKTQRHYKLMPEPIEEFQKVRPREARIRLGIPSEGKYIGCFGHLDNRKGIALLLNAFRLANLNHENRVLLLGKHEPSIKHTINAEFSDLLAAGRVISKDRFLSEQELSLAFDACDIVATPYPEHVGSSGILLRGAKHGKLTLTNDFAWLGWITNRFRLGEAVDVKNIEAFANSIVRSFERIEDVPLSIDAELFKFHSEENFKLHWIASICEAEGISPLSVPNRFFRDFSG